MARFLVREEGAVEHVYQLNWIEGTGGDHRFRDRPN